MKQKRCAAWMWDARMATISEASGTMQRAGPSSWTQDSTVLTLLDTVIISILLCQLACYAIYAEIMMSCRWWP